MVILKNKFKRSELFRKSISGLFLLLLLVFLVNYISQFLFSRIDLTSEKRYSLSAASKTILSNLKDDLYFKIYLSGDDLPPGFKRLKNAIKEMLDEFKIVGNERIEYEFIDPYENPDAKTRDALFKDLYKNKGLAPVELKENNSSKKSQRTIFPGAILLVKDKEVAINLLKNNQGVKAEENLNNSIQALEYELINSIYKSISQNKPRIAFLEGHGELNELQVIDISNVLSEYYPVERGTIAGIENILNPYSAVIVADPKKAFSEKDKYVLDQYLMQGGKLLWFIDGVSANMDSLYRSAVTMGMAANYNIEDQFFRYGARVNPDLVVDLQCAPIGLIDRQSPNHEVQLFSWVYSPVLMTTNQHNITKYISLVKTEFVSSVDTVGAKNIKKSILLTSSKNSRVLHVPVKISLDAVNHEPEYSLFSQAHVPLAVLLEGNFESVYKNRMIPDGMNKQKFIENGKHSKMIVVGDGDMIRNEISAQGEPYPIGFDVNSQKTFQGNKEFILNAVNYLCDDIGIVSLRLREIKMRLLDKAQVAEQRVFWQTLNTAGPIVFLLVFAFMLTFIRKRKYGVNR